MNEQSFYIQDTDIDNCKIYSIRKFPDHRGYFSEIYHRSTYLNTVAQINCSFSHKKVLRGIHEATFGKLVSCVKGRIFDVCIDLRPTSKTYGGIVSVELSESNGMQIYIPPNCGHGFYAYEDSIVVYSQTDVYSKLKETTHCYKNFNINWPFGNKKIILSEKDSC